MFVSYMCGYFRLARSHTRLCENIGTHAEQNKHTLKTQNCTTQQNVHNSTLNIPRLLHSLDDIKLILFPPNGGRKP